MDRLTPQEGLAGIAMLAMYADGVVRGEEDDALRQHLVETDLLSGANDEELSTLLVKLEKLSREQGPDALLRACCGVLDPDTADEAYGLAWDIIEADGEVAPEESEFLAKLETLLA